MDKNIIFWCSFMKYIILKRILSALIIIILISSIYIPQIISIENTTEYELIIISPVDFSNNLIPLVNHKINMGISTILISLDEIYDNQISIDGRDEAEKNKILY